MIYLVYAILASWFILGLWFTVSGRIRARRCDRWRADFDFSQPCHVRILREGESK
jgi:hypothetical protein